MNDNKVSGCGNINEIINDKSIMAVAGSSYITDLFNCIDSTVSHNHSNVKKYPDVSIQNDDVLNNDNHDYILINKQINIEQSNNHHYDILNDNSGNINVKSTETGLKTAKNRWQLIKLLSSLGFQSENSHHSSINDESIANNDKSSEINDDQYDKMFNSDLNKKIVSPIKINKQHPILRQSSSFHKEVCIIIFY